MTVITVSKDLRLGSYCVTAPTWRRFQVSSIISTFMSWYPKCYNIFSRWKNCKVPLRKVDGIVELAFLCSLGGEVAFLTSSEAARGLGSKEDFFSRTSASCSRNAAAMKGDSVLPASFHDEAGKTRGFSSVLILTPMIFFLTFIPL